MSNLLIIGANGELGSAASKYFLQKGFKVSGLVRNKKNAAKLEEVGVQLIIGDITKPDSINNILKEIDIVITAAHGMLGKGKNKSQFVDEDGHKFLIDEAKKAGVKHFIYTSISTASPNHPIDFFRTKYAIEQHLIKSGLDYTILRLPPFMEWHVYNLLGKSIIEKAKTTILGSGKNPTNFIAINDVVAAMDMMMMNKDYYNKTIPVAGPQNISRNEIADLFGKALRIKPKVGHVPITALKILSILFNPFHPGISRVMKLAVATENNDETMDIKNSVMQFGLSPTSIEEFIQQKIHKH